MDSGFLERFAGVGRLYGRAGLGRLAESSFMVVGLGGVGSWTVEALARSGVGSLTLVDGDSVCASNTNRQLHAVEGAAGRPKTEAMAERARAIRPGLRTELRDRFVTRANAAGTLEGFSGVVVDAIDALSPKCALLDECRRRGLRTVSVGGCAGRTDGTRLRVSDLSQSRDDALLMLVRKRLRQNFGFPRKGAFGISCVWSDEPPVSPADCEGLPGGTMPEDEELRPNCEWGYGTAAHVAGAFGLAAAGEAIRLALTPPA
ncbi:MAG: ThiF family adenylyltransferase [Opitutia bacterium]